MSSLLTRLGVTPSVNVSANRVVPTEGLADGFSRWCDWTKIPEWSTLPLVTMSYIWREKMVPEVVDYLLNTQIMDLSLGVSVPTEHPFSCDPACIVFGHWVTFHSTVWPELAWEEPHSGEGSRLCKDRYGVCILSCDSQLLFTRSPFD